MITIGCPVGQTPMVELYVAKNQRKRQAVQAAATSTRGIDMDALICLDMSHQWRMVEAEPARAGVFRGTPRRAKLCMVCGSLKIEVVNWQGYIITRQYKSAEAFIENARKLSPVPNERRAVYRRLTMGRPPKNVCQKCWLVHDSADCPIYVD